jgi:replicative DNA helicase
MSGIFSLSDARNRKRMVEANVKCAPHNTAQEKAVLGAALYDQTIAPKMAPLLTADHFFHETHKYIWRAIVGCVEEGLDTTCSAILSWLAQRNQSSAVDERVLEDLRISASTETVRNLQAYIRDLKDLDRARRILWILECAVAELKIDIGEAQAFFDRVIGDLKAVANVSDRRRFADNKSVLREHLKTISKKLDDPITGVRTGFRPLDRHTRGLHQGDLCVLAARSGMGKTMLAGLFAMNAASTGVGVLFFSWEMPREQVLTRMICAASRVPLKSVTDHEVFSFSEQRNDYVHEATRIGSLPLHIIEGPPCGLEGIRSTTLEAIECGNAQGTPIGLVVIDNINIIRPDGKVDSRKPRHLQINETLIGCKELATEFRFPILVLAQLRDDVDQDQGKGKRGNGRGRRPTRSDIRDSSGIEDNADAIFILHRDLDENGFKHQTEGHLIIDKLRNGADGVSLPLKLDLECTRFLAVEDTESEPDERWG